MEQVINVRLNGPSDYDDAEKFLKTQMMADIRMMVLKSGKDEHDFDSVDEPVEFINNEGNWSTEYLTGIFLAPPVKDTILARRIMVLTESTWGENFDIELTEEQPYQFVRDVYEKVYSLFN